MKTFKDLWINDFLLKKIQKKWYKNPSPIQEAVIPLLLKWEKDIIWQAQTGSWKTAAFALPLLQKIDPNFKSVQAVILAPTRELAIQIANEFKSFSDKNLRIQLLYGWQSIQKELDGLKRKPQIVIWTTWRILDHLINKKSLDVNNLKYLVLDEADEMLNMWFIEDIEKILKYTPENKQILLFSATMPKAIKNLAMKYLNKPDEVKIERKELTNPNIEQKYYMVDNKNKFDALCRILETEPDFYGIIFCRTKSDVDEISKNLLKKWYKAEAIHWDISQNLRERTLWRFRNQAVKILVATDVAARWIDINNLTHVINYSLPENPEVYTHRIWRTWRAWNTGEAISLVSPKETRNLAWIEKTIKHKIQKSELPKPEELITAKRQKLINNISEKIIKNKEQQYLELAQDLLKIDEPVKVIAALLEEAFWNEYLTTHYKDFKETTNNKQIRVFIAKWRKDWIKNPGQLIKFLEQKSNYKLWDVWQIDIKENFSFANLNEDDAFILIKHFKKINPRKPIVSQAKTKKN